MHQPSSIDAYMSSSSSRMVPHHEVSPIFPWTLPSSSSLHHGFNQAHHQQIDPFLLPPLQPPASSLPYGGYFNPRIPPSILQFAYDDNEGITSNNPFRLQGDFQTMSTQQIMDAKAIAASKNHSEAERRRRERINNHFSKLRSILPNTTKTDKASLLAEVIQHVKELRRQTSIIAETCAIPSEIDELTVDNQTSDEDGMFMIKVSLCCEDRADLLPELINTLKALKLRTVKAEITTVAGRVKNVLFITNEDEFNNNNNGDDDEDQEEHIQYCISSIQEAMKTIMEKSSGSDDSASGNVKRQRTNNNILN